MAGYRVQREAYGILFRERAAFKDTYGGEEGRVFLEAYRLVPEGIASDTVLLFMHPVGGGGYLPMVVALAAAGHHVIYANSRYRGNDSALIMEKVALDMAAAIRHAKETFGYERVVLAGWSGGGSLSLFYQSQAAAPTVTATPAGDPPDLTAEELIPADAMMLLAAHPSRHQVLADCIDPAVRNEDFDDRDPELDLFGPVNAPPYDAEFLARYHAAQVERVRRITATVKERLASLRAAGRGDEEHGFVVPGTMADPRAFDPAVDPNDREPGTSFIGDPRIANNGPIGLARFSTLRSWLSQWSIDDAHADGQRCGGQVTVPVLVVSGSADNICTPRYARSLFEGLASEDKQAVVIEGATHYYIGRDQMPRLGEAVAHCSAWLAARGLAPAQASEALA